MDQKSWLWRKRSSEKTIVSNEDEIQSIPDEKEIDVENSSNTLNEKLASVLDECSEKDKLVQDYKNRAEKAEDEVRRLQDELDETRNQNVALNERLADLNTALKDSMGKLKTSNESEISHKKIEQKLSETSTSLASENSYLTKALLVKEKLIDDLNNTKHQKDAEFEALMTRLDSTEKENAFLRYEFHSLETELDHLNEETECVRRSLEASNKRNSDNVKKIKKLEDECQRLRTLTRKRLPGPTKSDPEGTRRKDLTGRIIRDLENENKVLKERLAKSLSDQHSFASSRSWDHECKMIGAAASEMSLMDDFAEMERLALVAIDAKRGDNWIQDVKNIISEQHDNSKRSVDEIIGDIRTAFEGNARPEPSKLVTVIDQNHPTVRDEFRKYLGGAGPGTAFELESVQNLMIEMEKMFSVFQLEIKDLRNEMNVVKSSDESWKSIVSLKNEMEMLRESKLTAEDETESLKLINVDLDIQLTVNKSKLNDLIQKLSSVEVELDDKRQCCEELEEKCLELRLQLASVASNKKAEENENQEELLHTGLEITKATVKLAECEQTIMKLGKQLKALGSTTELSVVEKVDLSETKMFKQRSSLRNQMICEDNNEESNDLQQSPKTKEIISTTNGNVPHVSRNSMFSFLDGQVATPNIGALVIVPSKTRIGFLRKLLLRRKKQNSKNIYFGK
ncbi:hypothetical protein CASFOL_036054 [Castilleja foliolosa]|uniref:Uncharacterized protein n=1 Tax=Castilleja foliolosa TaxID=1961234 RepID=A0ABD3BV52_9LAMI